MIFGAKHSEEQLLYSTCGFHAFVLFLSFYVLTLLESCNKTCISIKSLSSSVSGLFVQNFYNSKLP